MATARITLDSRTDIRTPLGAVSSANTCHAVKGSTMHSITNHERHEIARKLREEGRIWDSTNPNPEWYYNRIDRCLGNRLTFDGLADLIDPTCHCERDNDCDEPIYGRCGSVTVVESVSSMDVAQSHSIARTVGQGS